MFQILVAEDDKNTARLMKAVLEHAGYTVCTADNGQTALELLDRQHVDLIMLDVMMPVMDGYTFAETLRSCGDRTPILMVTAKDLPEEKCRGFLAGTDDYMVKPVNEDEMLLRIRALLRRAQVANEHLLRVGRVVLDYDAQTVSRDGTSQTIPQKRISAFVQAAFVSEPDLHKVTTHG